MEMNESFFKTLSQAYGDKSLWIEVESELKAMGQSMDISYFFDPFKNLIIGILSQNTSDENSVKAWIGLTDKFEITPQTLAKADLGELRESIRSGGLYNLKSKRIKEFSKAVLEKFDGDLTKLAKLPKEEAREKLLELPGIGQKTADVWLAYCANHGVMAVDTNVDRVAKRLGIVSSNATYEEIRIALEKIIPSEQMIRGHELLVRLGRDYCKPKNPLCGVCPVVKFCEKKIA